MSQFRHYDLAMAGISAMLVIGFIFFGFGMAGWLFFSTSLAWTFWLFGLGFWALALAIFFYYMNDPYPKHKLGR